MQLYLWFSLFVSFIANASAEKTTTPPCCRDTLTSCGTTMRKGPDAFRKRCDSEADFRLIQCCATCEANSPTRDYNTAALPLANAACFDSESSTTCKKYVDGTGAWSAGTWRCDGASAAVAFRICRLSCGYCTSGSTATTVTYDWLTAVNVCSGLGK